MNGWGGRTSGTQGEKSPGRDCCPTFGAYAIGTLSKKAAPAHDAPVKRPEPANQTFTNQKARVLTAFHQAKRGPELRTATKGVHLKRVLLNLGGWKNLWTKDSQSVPIGQVRFVVITHSTNGKSFKMRIKHTH